MRHIFKMMLGLSSICFLISSLINCLNSHDISNKIQNKIFLKHTMSKHKTVTVKFINYDCVILKANNF